MARPRAVRDRGLARPAEVAHRLLVHRGECTSVSSSARNGSASLLASRRSVFTRSPGRRGISAGAITRQSMPSAASWHWSAKPVGPCLKARHHRTPGVAARGYGFAPRSRRFAALVLVGCEPLFPDVEDWIADSETLARRFDARLGDLQGVPGRGRLRRGARLGGERLRHVLVGGGRAASLHRSGSRRRSGRGSTGSVRVWKGCWRCRALTRSGASRSCGWRRTGSARESETTLNPGSGKRRNGAKARNTEPNEEQQPQPAPREQERQGEPARVSGRVA